MGGWGGGVIFVKVHAREKFVVGAQAAEVYAQEKSKCAHSKIKTWNLREGASRFPWGCLYYTGHAMWNMDIIQNASWVLLI